MAFDLKVTMTGLCMFLPDTSDASAPKMHVLLLMPGSGHHSVERHYPRIFYHVRHDPHPRPSTDQHNCISIEEKVLDLSKFIGRRKQQLPTLDEVIDLSPIVGEQRLLPKLKTLDVAARLTLAPGDAECPTSGPWDLGDGGRNDVAWNVVWTISDIPQAELTWELSGLRPDSYGQALPPLTPKPAANRRPTIELLVSNVVKTESKPELPGAGVRPKKNTPMAHFGAYYDLYDAADELPDARPIPIFKGEDQKGGKRPFGTPYTCVPVKAK